MDPGSTAYRDDGDETLDPIHVLGEDGY